MLQLQRICLNDWLLQLSLFADVDHKQMLSIVLLHHTTHFTKYKAGVEQTSQKQKECQNGTPATWKILLIMRLIRQSLSVFLGRIRSQWLSHHSCFVSLLLCVKGSKSGSRSQNQCTNPKTCSYRAGMSRFHICRADEVMKCRGEDGTCRAVRVNENRCAESGGTVRWCGKESLMASGGHMENSNVDGEETEEQHPSIHYRTWFVTQQCGGGSARACLGGQVCF